MNPDLDLLPDTAVYVAKLRELIDRVNGFVYAGDRFNAVIDTIKVLRANPELAAMLLAPEPVELTASDFPPSAWKEAFSRVPPYPLDLPDELRRTIVGAANAIRDAGQQLEQGRRNGDLLTYLMPLSLIRGAVVRMEEWAPDD